MWKIIGAANAKKEEPNGSGKPDIQPEAKPEAKKAFSCVCGGSTWAHNASHVYHILVCRCAFVPVFRVAGQRQSVARQGICP